MKIKRGYLFSRADKTGALNMLRRHLMETKIGFTRDLFRDHLSSVFDKHAVGEESAYCWNFGECLIEVFRSNDPLVFHGLADYACVTKNDAWIAFLGEHAKRNLQMNSPEFHLPKKNPEACAAEIFNSLDTTLEQLQSRFDDDRQITEHLLAQARPLADDRKAFLRGVFAINP